MKVLQLFQVSPHAALSGLLAELRSAEGTPIYTFEPSWVIASERVELVMSSLNPPLHHLRAC
jgi:hypothetical protein